MISISSFVPFVRGKTNHLLKDRDYLFDRLNNIIKQRRIEIENTPLDQPLSHDMLTSFITANTSRDVNSVKHADADLLRPMTDKEVMGNLLDALIGGTDTVSYYYFCFLFLFTLLRSLFINSTFLNFLNYRRQTCFAFSYIISDIILK